jgi:CheY-like chemotaxis protein
MRKEPCILIAEDDADDRYLLEYAFRNSRLTAKLSFVSDGVQLLQFLNASSQGNSLPDLIVLDLNMPLMNGTDTLIILKGHELYKHIPVIIHSTSDNETDKVDCIRLGASHYIYKGDGIDKMIATAQFIYEYSLTNGNNREE